MAEKNGNFFKGMLILSVSTIIVKMVSLLFSIPIINIVGPTGFGYFNAAYKIFAVFNAAATAGLPIAVSKMVSDAYTLGKIKQADRIYSVATTFFVSMGAFFSLLMFFFSKQIAVYLLHMPNANYAIKALAPTIFFCSVMSATRGYFQGRSNMMPTAISQTMEAVAKLFVGLGLALYVQKTFGREDLAAAAAIIGVSFSAGIGALFLVIQKRRQKNKDLRESLPDEDAEVLSKKQTLKNLLKFAVPITIGACFLYAMVAVDTGIAQSRLQNGLGMTEKAATALEGLWGSTIKIYDIPGAMVIALSTSVLPAIAAAIARKDYREVRHTTSSAMRITFLISIPCAVAFILLAEPIGMLFYSRKPEVAASVTWLLPMVAASVIFNAMQYTTNAVMQAMGRTKRPIIHMGIGAVLKIIMNYFLLVIPELNIGALAISTVVTDFIVMVLNMWAVYKLVPKVENPIAMTFPILVSSAVMGGAAYGMYFLLSPILPSLVAFAMTMIVAIAVYAVMGIFTKAIRAEELRMMPKGDVLIRKFHIYRGLHFE
jgi:Membrane protein involved in the export of O-antigen and teichoic acid